MHFDHRLSVAAIAALVVVCAPVVAQTGNLVPNGRFDFADGVTGWTVVFPDSSSLTFDGSLDADGCTGSGVALGTADSIVDGGAAMFTICLGAVSPSDSFHMSGELRFESSTYPARANLTLGFFDGVDCGGADLGGGFAGFAVSDVAGWQHLEAGPVLPAPTVQSAELRVFLTQMVGSDPAIQVQFDEIRVTHSDWIFAEDFEVGETCRWSLAPL